MINRVAYKNVSVSFELVSWVLDQCSSHVSITLLLILELLNNICSTGTREQECGLFFHIKKTFKRFCTPHINQRVYSLKDCLSCKLTLTMKARGSLAITTETLGSPLNPEITLLVQQQQGKDLHV